MKVNEIKTGELFVIDNTMTRPKLKLSQGYLDIFSLIKFSCRGDATARVLTEVDIMKLRINWGMTLEKFEDYKQMLVRRYIKNE